MFAILIPNSSLVSLIAASSGVSPISICPPGPHIRPLSFLFPIRTFPSFTTITPQPVGMTVSFKESVAVCSDSFDTLFSADNAVSDVSSDSLILSGSFSAMASQSSSLSRISLIVNSPFSASFFLTSEASNACISTYICAVCAFVYSVLAFACSTLACSASLKLQRGLNSSS